MISPIIFAATIWSINSDVDPRRCNLGDEWAAGCFTIVGVHDGDTFTIDAPGLPGVLHRVAVRVRGIDTPEMHGSKPCEHESALAAQKAAAVILTAPGAVVRLTHVGRDKYFRLLADVDVNGADLATLMLADGYGVRYGGGTKLTKTWCQ